MSNNAKKCVAVQYPSWFHVRCRLCQPVFPSIFSLRNHFAIQNFLHHCQVNHQLAVPSQERHCITSCILFVSLKYVRAHDHFTGTLQLRIIDVHRAFSKCQIWANHGIAPAFVAWNIACCYRSSGIPRKDTQSSAEFKSPSNQRIQCEHRHLFDGHVKRLSI